MKSKNFGAWWKRGITPADRHIRAVSCRHRSLPAAVLRPAEIEEPAVIAETAEEAVCETAETCAAEESTSVTAAAVAGAVGLFGKLKGMFARKKTEAAEAEEVPVPAAAEEEPVTEPETPAEETAEEDEISEEEIKAFVAEATAEEKAEGVTSEASAEAGEETAETTEEEAEPAETPAEAEKMPAAETAEEEMEEHEVKKSLFGRMKDHRTARKNEKRAQLDWEAELPRNGLFTMLLFPGSSIDRENREKGPVFGSFASLLVNLIKWPVVCSALVYPVYRYIGEKSFSIIRMNFTSAALLVLKLSVFCFLCEYVIVWILGFAANILQKSIEKRKLISSVSRGSLGIALAFAAAGAVMYFKGYALGFAALTAAAVYSISLFAYGVDSCMRMNKTLQLLIITALVFAFAFAGYKYIEIVAPDVIKMVQYIANL